MHPPADGSQNPQQSSASQIISMTVVQAWLCHDAVAWLCRRALALLAVLQYLSGRAQALELIGSNPESDKWRYILPLNGGFRGP